jgi:hypothetical protein
MVRRLALIFLGLASPGVLVCSCFSGFFAQLGVVFLVMAFPIALMVIAVARKGRLGPLTAPLLALGLILEISGIAILILRGQVVEAPWFGAFPLAAAIQIYGLWLGLLVLVSFAYGLTFDRWELPEEDLRRFEARCRAGSHPENPGGNGVVSGRERASGRDQEQ